MRALTALGPRMVAACHLDLPDHCHPALREPVGEISPQVRFVCTPAAGPACPFRHHGRAGALPSRGPVAFGRLCDRDITRLGLGRFGPRQRGQTAESQMAELGLDWKHVRAILLTHVHGDHSGGAEWLRAATGARIYAGEGDVPVLRSGKPREAFFSTYHMPDQHAAPDNDRCAPERRRRSSISATFASGALPPPAIRPEASAICWSGRTSAHSLQEM